MATNSRPLASAPRSCTTLPLPSTSVLPLTLMARPVEGEEPVVVVLPEPLMLTVVAAGVPTAAPVEGPEIASVNVLEPVYAVPVSRGTVIVFELESPAAQLSVPVVDR